MLATRQVKRDDEIGDEESTSGTGISRAASIHRRRQQQQQHQQFASFTVRLTQNSNNNSNNDNNSDGYRVLRDTDY